VRWREAVVENVPSCHEVTGGCCHPLLPSRGGGEVGEAEAATGACRDAVPRRARRARLPERKPARVACAAARSARQAASHMLARSLIASAPP